MGINNLDNIFSSKWRYLIAYAVAIVLFLYFYNSYFYESNILVYITSFQSGIASFVLNVFGHETTVIGPVLSNLNGSISVARGCDGVEPISMYLLAILIVPLSFNKKLPGILIGIGVLLVLNIIRIIILFLASIYFPSLFDFLHIHGGYIIFMIITIVIWLSWLNWALKPNKDSETKIFAGGNRTAK